jgi:hypothetical protein
LLQKHVVDNFVYVFAFLLSHKRPFAREKRCISPHLRFYGRAVYVPDNYEAMLKNVQNIAVGGSDVAAKVKSAARLVLGKQIKAQFGDGKWYSFETIVTKTGGRAKKVWGTLDRMWRWGTYKTKCERKKVGTEYHFRLSLKDKQISVQELIEKLTPILKELEVQGRANAATMSPPTVRIMTAKIQKLLEEWAE